MKAVKAVKFQYKPSEEVLSTLETFRQMCNDAVRIAIDQDAQSRFDLIELEGRRLMCPSCKQEGDRDEIASKNMMAAPLVRAARPDR